MIIDAKSRTLWLFYIASNNPPLHILRWFFANLMREKLVFSRICVDEDGALAKSAVFCKFICDEVALNLETTGGYDYYLNG
jgi:hypothetical protein